MKKSKLSHVSYPHEWPTALLKDVVLTRSKSSKALKALLPKLADKLIVNKKSLKNDYDFISYALVPLMLMEHKKHQEARKILKNNLGRPSVNKEFKCGRSLLPNLLQIIEELDVAHHSYEHTYKNGGYASYYAKKKESFSLTQRSEWGKKQKNVYQILKELQPKTVLDLGANTGWFSLLAESTGAEVIATDIDETSINVLYEKVKAKQLNILPLILPFEDYLNTKKLANGYAPSIKRMGADLVLCLALIHHLVFMGELTLEQIFQVLASLTKKTLVLEFVELEDAQAQNALTNKAVYKHPGDFEKARRVFTSYAKKNYNLESAISVGLQFFSSVSVLESHPEMRKLLIFSK